MNIVFAIILFLVFVKIFHKNSASPALTITQALELIHLPVLWFFIFLYYTDLGSALFTILCYFFAH